MTPIINQALGYGFGAAQILKFLSTKFPQISGKIKKAQAQGSTPEQILGFIASSGDFRVKRTKESEARNYDYQQYKQNTGITKHDEPLNRAAQSASELMQNSLPYLGAGLALKGMMGIGQGVRQAAGGQLRNTPNPSPAPMAPTPPPLPHNQLPQAQAAPMLGGPQPPQVGVLGTPMPSPSGGPPPIAPPQPANPQQNLQPLQITEQKKPIVEDQEILAEEIPFKEKNDKLNTLWNVAKSGKGIVPAEDKEFMKFSKQLVKNGTIENPETFNNFYKYWNATEGTKRKAPAIEFEKFRSQTGWLKPNKSNESNALEPKETTNSDFIITPSGEVGQVKSDKGKYSTVDVNGKNQSFKNEKLEKVKPDLVNAARSLVDQVNDLLNIPESDRSSNFHLSQYSPHKKTLTISFHSGDGYEYYDISPEEFEAITEGRIAKTTGGNEYGVYVAGEEGSRGAGFDQIIKKNPKYSKQNEGKTWNKLKVGFDYYEKLRKKKKK